MEVLENQSYFIWFLVTLVLWCVVVTVSTFLTYYQCVVVAMVVFGIVVVVWSDFHSSRADLCSMLVGLCCGI